MWQVLRQRVEILIVRCSVRQFDVERGLCFEKRVVVCAVHREGKCVCVSGKDRCGAVALVYVAIDYGRALCQFSCAQSADRDRDVVEHAESFAAIGKRMMRAAGQIRAEATVERRVCSGNRAAGCVERSAHERFGPGKSETPDLFWR